MLRWLGQEELILIKMDKEEKDETLKYICYNCGRISIEGGLRTVGIWNYNQWFCKGCKEELDEARLEDSRTEELRQEKLEFY